MYCVFLGRAVATNAPGAGSVGASQLASDAVTAAKLNDDIISGQTALGATPADTDEFLVSDAGTIKRVDYSYLKVNNTPAFSAYANADQTGLADNTWVKLAMNAEFYDTDSKYDVSSYRFTPTVSGKYVFGAEAYIDSSNTIDSVGLAFYKNGSKLFFVIENVDGTTANSISATIDLDSDDYVEIYGYADVASSGTWNLNQDGTTSNNRVFWFGYKLIT
jgi:hypothetical protein